MMRFAFVLGVFLYAFQSTAKAESAAEFFARKIGANIISVTRKDNNEYEVSSKNVIIKTRYCYEYVYYEDAIVIDDTLVFLEENEICDIEGIYRKER